MYLVEHGVRESYFTGRSRLVLAYLVEHGVHLSVPEPFLAAHLKVHGQR